ncbi:MAG: 1-deoxy-D-xylulose-5-phosphate synthase [Fimbriimonadaceae bacterium]
MSQNYELLSKITRPEDLHRYSVKELEQVARELRQAIMDNISRTGGHFSSNLGTVELTVAMYAAYRTPPDKIIWDTGHQAYPHKMLTGRLDRFPTLRKYKGISGFLKRSEHELDHFGAGHAGTAISAALGFATARDQAKTSEKVVAVTGDAAILSGMCWEAMNHAGELQTDLQLVMNDNRMSIAPNVGAMTSYFTRLRSRPEVQSIAYKAKGVIEKLPSPVERVASGLRHGVTHYFAPENAGTIFEELGFEYIGPVDGHNLPVLLEIFQNLREIKRPVFLHAITVKGKGYKVAEEDATKWHGVVPFDPNQEEMPKGKGGPVKYTSAFGSALCDAAKRDSKVVAITAAMPDGTGLNGFQEQFPDRYFDTGIAEQHAVTLAAGQAAGGLKPFCTIYSTFLQRGYDQVLHDVCIQNLPVRFCMDRSGLVGADGPTHHGVFDISFLTQIPNMHLVAPRDATELTAMIDYMVDFEDGPIAVRYPRGTTDDRLPESRTSIEYGKAELLGVPNGSRDDEVSLTIAAVGSAVGDAWQAATKFKEEGLNVQVVNVRWLKPIDFDSIFEAAEGNALVTVEENVRAGGFGQQVRDEMAERGLSIPSRVLTVPDRFVDHGSQGELRREIAIDAEGIYETCRALLRKESGRLA